MFCKALITMVDEPNGCAQIVEICSSRGPKEWDIVNRRRTRGIITDIRDEGAIVMDLRIGEAPLNFGPASEQLGGQGIYSLAVEGDRVRTKWKGIAGASVGIGACLPQAMDVIETVYPDDFMIGGANVAETEIVTHKRVRLLIGVDDTDTPQRGASWVVTMGLGRDCPYGIYLDHKIVQLNPKAPNKTTNCCSTAVSFAALPEEVPKIIEYAKTYVREHSYSDDTVMTSFTGLRIPEALRQWSWDAKSVLYTVEDAIRVAADNGVSVHYLTGSKGAIGAVAAIGSFDMGLKAAGIPEDFQ